MRRQSRRRREGQDFGCSRQVTSGYLSTIIPVRGEWWRKGCCHPLSTNIGNIPQQESQTALLQAVLKRNKYVGILSIAVTTLQYITISMITIFSMYIAHVHLGSGATLIRVM